MPKIIVDWGACDGNGTCTLEAPSILEMDDADNLIVLKETFEGEALLEEARRAVRSCPKQALRLDEDA